MLHFLTVFSLVASVAQAQSFGFSDADNDVPAQQQQKPIQPARPAPTPPPAPKPQQLPKVAAPPNFKQCAQNQVTSNVDEVRSMIKHILNIDSPYNRKLLGPKTWGGENSFTLSDSSSELQVTAVKNGNAYFLPAFLCQIPGGLVARIEHPMQINYIVIRPVNPYQVSIAPVVNGMEIGQQHAVFAFETTSARGMQ